MTLLNDRHANELFRYMNVRAPLRNPEEEIPTYFVNNIYDRLSKKDLGPILATVPLLYPTLITRIGRPKQLSDQMADVATYQKSPGYIANQDDYRVRFPGLTSFLSWMDVHASATTIRTVTNKFNNKVGQDMAGYVKSIEFTRSQCVLWDNLLAGLFLPNKPALVTLACKYLAGLHLAELIASLSEPEELASKLSNVYHAKPLVPKWVFEVFATGDVKPDTGVGDQQPGEQSDATLATRFNNVDASIREVRTLINRRTEAQRQALDLSIADTSFVPGTFSGKGAASDGQAQQRKVVSDKVIDALRSLKSPYELTPAESGGLSATTTDLIRRTVSPGETLNLEAVLVSLLEEAAAVSASLGSKTRETVVRVGDAIISKNDLCAEMIDRDPCARLPRKQFESKGSFMTSALIGDLLLTKQQLIKYNAGEVAHVEAVMIGLEKQRTHRRLNRTETTTTLERESVNESERETQTTERFSMEKETSKTLNQDFKISTGVNTSGTYGMVSVTSSLDVSFGISQTQADKTATSFSKDVTNRALTRVKETVREMQTVTVINEVEETSVNKLSNTTADHINGVYRWLDKFYLNKIINYGKRLMFEFTIPEPANFYIFRKMTKPPAGAIIEKPAPPSEVVGPDGNRLVSPTVITDANYAFWIAQYGASEVKPPPQEYIWISNAYKNQYSTPQEKDDPIDLFDSFAAEITIPVGYEAVSANVSAIGNWWGDHSKDGVIGTAYFPEGTTSNIPLPNIRSGIGVTLLSRSINYSLNVTIRAKRSDESYNVWKLDSYGKIIEAYNRKKQAYDEWLNAQVADSTFGFSGSGNNPGINRETEREELKKRCIELFTGQRFESFDAATSGIHNVSGFPEILFQEAITEGNLVKFFEQAFEWENITYIFYPYFWGRKTNWLTLKNLEETSDPLFTKFLQAGYARVMVPARIGFENYLLIFNLLSNFVSAFGCSWNFAPSIFGALGISNDFLPGVSDPVYMSVTQELAAANGLDEENGDIIGHYIQKVPTNLVYVVPLKDAAGNPITPTSPLPGLPDNSADPEIQPYL